VSAGAVERDFVPVHVERTGTLRVNRPLAQAFPLFSPEGERCWVKGWLPRYLHPRGAASDAAGTVFQTHHNDEETQWLVLRYSPDDGIAEYVRITPGSRLGVVTVRATQRDGTTDVEVTYRLTSLSAAGTRTLDALTEESYAAMLREWETLIGDALGDS
jgi:hypothetical protein